MIAALKGPRYNGHTNPSLVPGRTDRALAYVGRAF